MWSHSDSIEFHSKDIRFIFLLDKNRNLLENIALRPSIAHKINYLYFPLIVISLQACKPKVNM